MNSRKRFFFAILPVSICFIFLSLNCDHRKIQDTDLKISSTNDILLYEGKKFSGIVESRMEAVNVTRHTPYSGGVLDGTEKEYYSNGLLSAERFYSNGKKVGIHRGWYADGKDRFWYEYDNGQLHGNLWEWHSSGPLITFARFDRGRLIGKKIWRIDGQIYANFVIQENRVVGLPGSKLCLQVRSDENKKTKSF
ncbi:MAG: hypothetical protein K8R21_14045 [Leptospira sp.]|nr:hypothetical protein [Leptospira sp.]